MLRLSLLSVVLAACAGDSSGPATCTGLAYDSCLEEHDCQSQICRGFNDLDVIICTTTCTVGDNSTCPKQGNAEVECTAAGVCKPTMANTCILSEL